MDEYIRSKRINIYIYIYIYIYVYPTIYQNEDDELIRIAIEEYDQSINQSIKPIKQQEIKMKEGNKKGKLLLI